MELSVTDNYMENAMLYSLILLNMPGRTEHKFQHKRFILYFKWNFKAIRYFRYSKFLSMDTVPSLLWKKINIFNQNVSNLIDLPEEILGTEWYFCHRNPPYKSWSK